MVKTALILLILCGIHGCSFRPGEPDSLSKADFVTPLAFNDVLSTDYSVPLPPISDLFPCSQCHADMEVNPRRRILTDMHDDIIFNHDSENRWCLACHDAKERDSLKLASGITIPFTNSYLLCGQCHGPKYRDWRMGIHGKRTGEWNGKKQYLLCVHCHDPHSPGIKPIEPMPPPKQPTEMNIVQPKVIEDEK